VFIETFQAWSLDLNRKIKYLRLGSNFPAGEFSSARAMLIILGIHASD